MQHRSGIYIATYRGQILPSNILKSLVLRVNVRQLRNDDVLLGNLCIYRKKPSMKVAMTRWHSNPI